MWPHARAKFEVATYNILVGAQWLSGRVLDLRPMGQGCILDCVLSLSKNINPSLVLVQPRKTSPFIIERLLIEHKESNQTKQTKQQFSRKCICKWRNSISWPAVTVTWNISKFLLHHDLWPMQLQSLKLYNERFKGRCIYKKCSGSVVECLTWDKGRRFEPHRRHCVVSLSKTH